MNQSIFFSSLIGKRDTNEDGHFISLNKNMQNIKYAPVDLFGIFDGHGGSEVSKFLSIEFPKYLVNTSIKYPWSKKQIITICDKIQERLKVFDYSYRVGSTALIVAVFEVENTKWINILNTGDCRAVICNTKNIGVQLTKDHSPNTFSENNRINELGGKPKLDDGIWRIQNLSVSRSFGDFDTFPYVTHRPDIYRYQIHNERFLIIACDGLWESLTNDSAVEFVLNNCYSIKNKITTRNKNITENNISKQLANYAINKGSQDNISVIIIFFD